MTSRSLSNADVRWDEFDADAYFRANYKKLRDDDREVIALVRDHFSAAAADLHATSRGVDVGAGANLYPCLAMLPFCGRVDLQERSRRNIRWMQRELRSVQPSWTAFWQVYQESPRYARLADPWEALRCKVSVRPANVLEPKPRTWDIGTMMFVAESMTEDVAEFHSALRLFLASLKADAPFAMAFMLGSSRYGVGKKIFPAVKIDLSDVDQALAGLTKDLVLTQVRTPAGGPVRPGVGMLVALGRAI